MKEKNILDEYLKKNEIRTNILISIASVIVIVGIFIYFILEETLIISNDTTLVIVGRFIILFLSIGPIICFITKGKGKYLKYVLLAGFIIASCLGVFIMEVGVYIILLLIPVTASCLYYSPKLTLSTAIFAFVCLTIMVVLNVFVFGNKSPDANYIVLKEGTSVTAKDFVYYDIIKGSIDNEKYFVEMCLNVFLPMMTGCFAIICICSLISRRVARFVLNEVDNLTAKIKDEEELNLASSIQTNMLPNKTIDDDKCEVNYYIQPARQVGGDFYDFFYIDDSHLVLVIGDVSDKGIPAAMFMARCKATISSALLSGYDVEPSINFVNKLLCSNNTTGMFVTAFIGVMNIKTGELRYINAGHCAPIIMNSNGEYKKLDVNIDLFLGGMSDIKYQVHTVSINKNEKILLYTDGIIEAINSKDELYGTNKVIKFLNDNKNLDNKTLINKLIDDIKKFENNLEPSDDKTILLYTRKGE